MKCFIGRLLLIFTLIPSSPAMAGTLGEILPELGLRWSKMANLAIISHQDRKGEKIQFRNIVAQQGGTRVELELITPSTEQDALARGKRLLAVIESQYGERKTPYPGELTNMSRCGTDTKPIRKELVLSGLAKVSALAAHASDRFAFGACEKSTIRQVGLVAVLFHRESSLQVRIFRPANANSRESLFDVLRDLESN